MATDLKLNLDEVRSLLGLSTDSILNHIEKGTLTAGKVKGKDEEIYVFEFTEVKDFAKEYLDMEVSTPQTKKQRKEKEYEFNTDEDQPTEAKGIASIFKSLQKSYEQVLNQMSDYKEQAAFRIGQLEGELSSQKKLLSSGQQELAEKDKLIKRLKIELKKTREDLETEITTIERMSLWERIWFKRN